MHGYKDKKSIEKDISSLEKNSNWISLMQKYPPVQVGEILGYKKGMRTANNIAYSNIKDDTVLKYAIDVIFSLRDLYPREWIKDWKNAAFLSGLCTIIWEYDKSYKILLEAYEKLADPPATLIFELANCYNYPPEFSLVKEIDAENLLKKSLSKQITYEAALYLKEIYKSKNALELYKYYDKIAKEAEKNNEHIEDMTPDVLKE